MPKFEIGIKKVRYGHAIVYAKDEEDAKKKVEHGINNEMVMYGGEDTIQQDCKRRQSEQ